MTIRVALINGTLRLPVHGCEIHFAVAIQILAEEIGHGVLCRSQHAVGHGGERSVGFSKVHGEDAELILARHEIFAAVAVVVGKAEGGSVDHAVRR